MKSKTTVFLLALAATLIFAVPAQASDVVGPSYGWTALTPFPTATQFTNQNGQALCGQPDISPTCDGSGLWYVGGNKGDPLAYARVGWYGNIISLDQLRAANANKLVMKVNVSYAGGPTLNTSATMAIKLQLRTGLPGCNFSPKPFYAPAYNVAFASHTYTIKWRSTCFQQATNGVYAGLQLIGQSHLSGDSFFWQGQLNSIYVTPHYVS